MKKKKQGGLLPSKTFSMNALLISTMTFSLINAITGKGGRRVGKEQKGEFPSFLAVVSAFSPDSFFK